MAMGGISEESRDEKQGKISSYQDLRVWRMGIELAKSCYLATKAFPRSEIFGLTSQIRRAAASIPANIAEGNGRENTGEYIQFLRIAQGSLKELETHLILSREIGICLPQVVGPLLEQASQLGPMLRSLIRSMQRKKSL